MDIGLVTLLLHVTVGESMNRHMWLATTFSQGSDTVLWSQFDDATTVHTATTSHD